MLAAALLASLDSRAAMALEMLGVPALAGVRPMPFRRSKPRGVSDLGWPALALVVRQVVAGGQEAKIPEGVIAAVPVGVMHMPAGRNRPVSALPHHAMKAPALALEIPAAAVVALAAELLHGCRQDHRGIASPFNSLARFHPFSVMKRWSGVHTTTPPSEKNSFTVRACPRVIRAPRYRIGPRRVCTSPNSGSASTATGPRGVCTSVPAAKQWSSESVSTSSGLCSSCINAGIVRIESRQVENV